MYFNPHVKEKKDEFFNFEVIQNDFKKAISEDHIPLIAIYGLRRTGKTSLVRVVLNSVRKKYIWIDSRDISSKHDFYSYISEQINQKRRIRINKISIKGIEFSLERHQQNLNYLNNHKMALVIDEAQLLKKFNVDYVLASIFDNHPNIKLIISGSEVGMLKRFLGENNAKAPLYGRAVYELHMHRLANEQAYEFLKRGFKEARVIVPDDELYEVVNYLSGSIGWLTKYGWHRLRFSHKTALQKTINEGKLIVKQEFLKCFYRSEKRYVKLLQTIRGGVPWKTISIKMDISDNQLSEMLTRLQDSGFIEKINTNYVIIDRLLEEAF